MTDLTWETPAPDQRGAKSHATRWALVAQALKDHPGEWAVVSTTTYTRGSTNKTALEHFGGQGNFETRDRSQPDGTYRGYARYIGEEKS